MVFLETVRLNLRNLREEDAATIYDYRNHPQCAQYQRGQTRTLVGIQELINDHKEDTLTLEDACFIAIEDRQIGELIGEVIVMPNERTFSLGYTVSYRYHRKGYGYEALYALIELLHNRYPAWEFICFVDRENTASRNLLAKLGYTDMGYLASKTSQVYGMWTSTETDVEIAELVEK